MASHPSRQTAVLLTAVLLATTGCERWQWFDFNWNQPEQTAEPEPNPVSEGPPPTINSTTRSDVVTIGMLFDVERVLIPDHIAAQKREKFRTYMDESRQGLKLAAYLARNGFRIGVTDAAGLEALRDQFDHLNATRERIQHIAQSGLPITLDLGSLPSNKSIFIFAPDGTLEGTSFQNATKHLHIDFDVVCPDNCHTTLRVTPEIFKQTQQPHWQVRDGTVDYSKLYEGRVFRELATDIELKAGEALIIGPSDPQDAKSALGNVLLTDLSAGRKWETLICIVPQPYKQAPPKDDSMP